MKRIRFICGAILVVAGALLVISFATARQRKTIFGTDLGYDYAAFYVAGQIQNEYGVSRLYDRPLQAELYHRLFPNDDVLPYANAPFLALVFRPLARLPYAASYVGWLVISMGLYVTGLALVLRISPVTDKVTAVLLALAFEPFLMECWIGGQMSAVGFFCLALALFCVARQKLIGAGMALALCLYKPTLLVLLLPMLVVSRQWKVLAGFVAGTLGLAAFCKAVFGVEVCLDYVRLLTGYAQATADPTQIFKTWKFVDLVSFARLLQRGHTLASWIIMGLIGAGAFAWLVVRWHRDRMLWAGTIAATLVLNLYVGIYDTALVVLAALLVPPRPATAVLLFAVPWFSQFAAQYIGLQLYTLVLAAFAIEILCQPARSLVVSAPEARQ